MKAVALLGSTGSIGRQAVDVLRSEPGAFRVVALAAGRRFDVLAEQAALFRPAIVAVAGEDGARALEGKLPAGTRVVHGPGGLIEAATHADASLVVNGLVGAAGVEPTYAALDAGKDVALANKEALVVGGAFLTARARETGATLIPVDSEHNALHQCLRGEDPADVRTIWLTASGGPFRTWSAERIAAATPEQALAHPTWSMGPKISIDSATLMNKGLEVVEAHWLFGLPADRIRVVVHPKSVVHSLVEMRDGSYKAQLGATDMRHPIAYALHWPKRATSPAAPFDLVAAGPLVFEEPDPGRFPCLSLCYEALALGGAAPAAANAANEIAVAAFLERRASFGDIAAAIRHVLDRHAAAPAASLTDLLAVDRAARETTLRYLAVGAHP